MGKYKRKLSSRRYREYSPEMRKECINEKKEITMKDVVKVYGISRQTIFLKLKDGTELVNQAGRVTVFTK